LLVILNPMFFVDGIFRRKIINFFSFFSDYIFYLVFSEKPIKHKGVKYEDTGDVRGTDDIGHIRVMHLLYQGSAWDGIAQKKSSHGIR
jgi:hypothetical protein